MKLRKKSLLLVLVQCSLLAVAGWQCAGLKPKPYLKGKIPIARVLIATTDSNVVMSCEGAFRFSSEQGVLFEKPKHSNTSIRRDENGGFVITTPAGEVSLLAQQLTVRSTDPRRWLRLNDMPYRGEFEIKPADESRLWVINILDLEAYLKGVIPAEMGVKDHIGLEAMKAQAVAARTYALRKLENSPSGLSYDLKASVSDQVYKGVAVENPIGNRAVESTTGEIITYDGNLIHAYYHSTCGGRTECGENVWGLQKPYLRGVADDFGEGDFCNISPHYRWIEIWDGDELASELWQYFGGSQLKAERGQLQALKVVERFPSGRVKKLQIDLNGSKYWLQGNKMRWVLRRPDKTLLRSTLFKLKTLCENGRVKAVMMIGAGNGHGVGMCQWGAISMARQGFTYEQILKHYYRGVEIERRY